MRKFKAERNSYMGTFGTVTENAPDPLKIRQFRGIGLAAIAESVFLTDIAGRSCAGRRNSPQTNAESPTGLIVLGPKISEGENNRAPPPTMICCFIGIRLVGSMVQSVARPKASRGLLGPKGQHQRRSFLHAMGGQGLAHILAMAGIPFFAAGSKNPPSPQVELITMRPSDCAPRSVTPCSASLTSMMGQRQMAQEIMHPRGGRQEAP